MTDLRLLCLGDLAFMEDQGGYDPQLPDADVATGNVEIVLADQPGLPADKLVHLLAPEATSAAYAGLRLDVVNLANNHTLDYGPAGVTSTAAALHAAGMQTVGAGSTLEEAVRPCVVEAGGIRVGVLGVTCVVPPGFAASASRPGVWAVRVRSYLESETHGEQPGAAPFVHTVAEDSDVKLLRRALAQAGGPGRSDGSPHPLGRPSPVADPFPGTPRDLPASVDPWTSEATVPMSSSDITRTCSRAWNGSTGPS